MNITTELYISKIGHDTTATPPSVLRGMGGRVQVHIHKSLYTGY